MYTEPTPTASGRERKQEKMGRKEQKELCHYCWEALAIVHVLPIPQSVYSYLWFPPSPPQIPCQQRELESVFLLFGGWQGIGNARDHKSQHYNVKFLLGNPIWNSQIIFYILKKQNYKWWFISTIRTFHYKSSKLVCLDLKSKTTIYDIF